MSLCMGSWFGKKSCKDAVVHKVIASFHHGDGTEVKTFYYEGTSDKLYEKIRSKVSEGWCHCGVVNLNHVTQLSP